MKRCVAAAAVASLILLSGCRAWEEYDAQAYARAEAAKKQMCADMGAEEGSKDYYRCRNDIENRMVMQQKVNADFALAGAVARPRSCRSWGMGNSVTTDCN